MSRRALRVAVAVVIAAAMSACSKKAPVAQLPPPPLEVPVVPPRLVGPVVVEEPAVPTAEAPEPTPPRQRPPRATAKGNGAGSGSEPVVKVEPPPESAKPPEAPNGQSTTPSAATAEAAPPPLLRTPDTADDEGVAKSVQDTLQRAQSNLNKVNYQALSPGAKAQHDTARRFIAQAQDALKSRRLDFARYLAEKADRLSASLLNR